MRNLFLNTLRYLSAREHQQETTKSGRLDEMVDSKCILYHYGW